MEHEQYDPLKRYPPNKFLKMIPGPATFPLLEAILDPTCTPASLSLRDAILVSIDLESRFVKQAGRQRIIQVGIASLDTRILAGTDPEDSEALIKAVKCQLFSVYPRRASGKNPWRQTFLWGTPERIEHDEIRRKLDAALHIIDESCKTQNADGKRWRNIILVGHAIKNDRCTLIQLLDFDLKEVASVKAILDTGRMVCGAHDLGRASHTDFPLNHLLRALQIQYDFMHDAGNDAMFTLKALLLMFSNWKHQKGYHLWNTLDEVTCGRRVSATVSTTLLWECQLEVLAAIARVKWPIRLPLKPDPNHQRPASKRKETRATDFFDEAGDLELIGIFD